MRHAQPGNNTTQYAEPACAGCGLPGCGIVKSSTWRFSCFRWPFRVFPNSQCFVCFFTCLQVMPRSGATRHVPRGHDRHMANLAKGANFVEATVPTDSMQRKDLFFMSFYVFFVSIFWKFPVFTCLLSAVSAPPAKGLTPHQVFPLFEVSCPRRWFS